MREVLAEGRHVRLVRQDGWEWAERRGISGVVAIIALTPDNEVLLVEQFRPPVQARVIELPAGLAGDIAGAEDEDLSDAALRELEEETGFTAAQIRKIGRGPISAGLTDELLTFFEARSLRRIGPGGGDASEDIVVHLVPADEVHHWLIAQQEAGTLVDPKVYAGLYWLTAESPVRP
jgi:ADP-ribose pyrophosphatase